mmetsp:Transcript_1847/g.5898  ORF Transcript_1847/g.5898 Transcript_1847/m.5898 type:complete len:453 (+) Transcript_1847:1750-3108(+)
MRIDPSVYLSIFIHTSTTRDDDDARARPSARATTDERRRGARTDARAHARGWTMASTAHATSSWMTTTTRSVKGTSWSGATRARRGPRLGRGVKSSASSSVSSASLVFGTGSSDAFDARGVSSPVVKYFASDDESRWMMWYTGASADDATAIGLATSVDGIEWQRGGSFTETFRNDAEQSISVGKVLWPNDEDWWTFDTAGVSVGDVQLISSDSISGGSVYWMFYHGNDREVVDGIEGARTRPGLCLSQDGRNWARVEGDHHTGALFDVGEAGAWDARCIRDPKVLLAGPSDIRLYYTSIDPSTGVRSIGLARTKDGFNYTKHAGGAVFGPGPAGAFDDAGVASPCVVRLGREEFIMFYEAYSSQNPDVATIAVATSKDGVKWTRASGPALASGAPGAWDAGGVGKPYAVPMAGDRIRLYYEGRNASNPLHGAGVGVALSVEGDRFAFTRRE